MGQGTSQVVANLQRRVQVIPLSDLVQNSFFGFDNSQLGTDIYRSQGRACTESWQALCFAERTPAVMHMFKSMCSVDAQMVSNSAHTTTNADLFKTTPVGFEPTRAEPIGLAGRRLNHSAKVSHGL